VALAGMFLVTHYAFAKSASVAKTKPEWEYCRLYASHAIGNSRYSANFATATAPDGADVIDSNHNGVLALNKLGADGWELVAVIPTPDSGGGDQAAYIFKRAKR